jgi:hypothetical protein
MAERIENVLHTVSERIKACKRFCVSMSRDGNEITYKFEDGSTLTFYTNIEVTK